MLKRKKLALTAGIGCGIAAALWCALALTNRPQPSERLPDRLPLDDLVRSSIVIRQHSDDGTWEVEGIRYASVHEACYAMQRALTMNDKRVLAILDRKSGTSHQQRELLDRISDICRSSERELFGYAPLGKIPLHTATGGLRTKFASRWE